MDFSWLHTVLLWAFLLDLLWFYCARYLSSLSVRPPEWEIFQVELAPPFPSPKESYSSKASASVVVKPFYHGEDDCMCTLGNFFRWKNEGHSGLSCRGANSIFFSVQEKISLEKKFFFLILKGWRYIIGNLGGLMWSRNNNASWLCSSNTRDTCATLALLRDNYSLAIHYSLATEPLVFRIPIKELVRTCLGLGNNVKEGKLVTCLSLVNTASGRLWPLSISPIRDLRGPLRSCLVELTISVNCICMEKWSHTLCRTNLTMSVVGPSIP